MHLECKFNWEMIREKVIYGVAVVKIEDVDKEDDMFDGAHLGCLYVYIGFWMIW